MAHDDGGPAFPAHDYVVGELSKDGFQKLGESRGMTLWDVFFALSMNANRSADDMSVPAKIVEWAAADADAMIAERKKRSEGR